MGVDWSKPIQTRDGKKAELLKILKTNDPYPCIVAIEWKGNEEIIQVRKNGRYLGSNCEDELDIINVPQKGELWVNIYKRSIDEGYFCGVGHKTKEESEKCKEVPFDGAICIARIKVEFEEGQFDE